jgi:WD40-like Beta Propeller Repeat
VIAGAGFWAVAGTEQADATSPGRNGLIGVNADRGFKSLMWVLRPDGRDVTRMPVYGEGAFAPDGRRLALTRGRVLSVTDLDGGNGRVVFRGAKGQLLTGAAWSATGDVLYFENFDDGLFSVPAAGGTPRRISRNGSAVDVSVSGRLAYQTGPGPEVPNVITADGGGGDRRDLGRGRSPSWSPDGARVAFARRDRILAAGLDGSAPATLLDLPDPVIPPGEPSFDFAPHEITYVEWSPDGTQIAFVRRARQDVLMVLDLVSGAVRRLLAARTIRSFYLGDLTWQPLTGADQITLPVAPPLTGPCQLLGSRTIVKTKRARIYADGGETGQEYGCLFAVNRRYRLRAQRSEAFSWDLGEVALAGRYAAYEYQWSDTHVGPFADLYVQNLRTGRIVRSINAIAPTRRVFLADVRRLVMSPRGSIAWVVRPMDPENFPRGEPRQVRTLRHGRAVTLDRGTGIRAASLQLRGSRLTWRHGAELRTARLR